VPVRAKILIADDQEFVRRTIRSMLSEQSDWKIYEAENGQVAVDQVPEIQPDVAVLDIVMPEMSGIEAAREIRKHNPQTKVILMSSHYTPEEAAAVARLFADGHFIQKSDLGKRLIPAIASLIPPKP
jgi:DNA-binding NarL/FixJ family response regulator